MVKPIPKPVTFFVLSFVFPGVAWTATEKRDAPPYLKEARLIMFMANEVVKYCDELAVDEESYKNWFALLQSRLATDGINDIKEEIKPASLSEIFEGVQKIMEENGGPFRFSADKYCRYGRKQMEEQTDIGILLREVDD